MHQQIILKSEIKVGVVATHFKFAGGVAPNEHGKFPRDANGVLRVLSAIGELCAISPVKMNTVQLPFFAAADQVEIAEMIKGLNSMGLEVYFIIMIGGANPMNPDDEDNVVSQLVMSIKSAIHHGIRHVSSTSIEEWMSSDEARTGAAFDAAVAQNVRLHLRAYQEAGIEGSCVKDWNIEFLRPGEFKTFTNIEKSWAFVSAMNKALGKKFFKLLVDAAHCGDSGLSLEKNASIITQIAAAGELGVFHASAKTTRGCLSTDDGWISALLTAAARTGELKHVFVELFDHSDATLELLHQLESGFGIDTRDGRTYTQVVADGLGDISRRLNNLTARGILKN